MKIFKRINRFYTSVWICSLLLLSCTKFVEVGEPRNEVASTVVFATEASATAAINGIYTQMMGSNLLLANGGITVFAGLSADELATTGPNAQYDPFFKNAVPADENTTVWNRFWRWGYNHIYNANAVIEGLDASTTLPEAFRNRLKGEALFIRAFCYYYLAGLFGDLPLVTGTDYTTNAGLPRRPVADIMESIATDLGVAITLLPEAYEGTARTRPNSGAAQALLARVQLARDLWQEAVTAATAVIGNSMYALETDPGLVFTPASTEAVWQLYPVSQFFNTAEGSVFIPVSPTARPALALTVPLVEAIQANGGSRKLWMGSAEVRGQTYYYPQKYKQRIGVEKLEYNTVFRLVEQYFIRAEAYAQSGMLKEALTDLNTIRQRAGLPDTSGSTKEAVLGAILEERRVELFAEWGHRWFDLKRMGLASAVLAPLKADWQTTDELYPVPLIELQRNPALKQNQGY